MRTETKNVPPPAAAKKLVEKKDLKQLSDQLREMKEDAFSKTVAGLSLSFFFLIEIIHNHVTDAFHDPKRPNGEDRSLGYCDEWPQFKAVAARITTPKLSSSRIGANDSCVYRYIPHL
ncbi:hypothetical protein EMCRGX_G026753 [Ephydatia muelleri]